MNVIAGDYEKTAIITTFLSTITLSFYKDIIRKTEEVDLTKNLAAIEILTQENKTSIASKAGYGIIGSIALGPVGALAGLLAGGNKTKIFFTITIADGRQFVVEGKVEDYKKLLKHVNPSLLPPPEIAQSTQSGADEIRKYKQLLDDGIITQEEFDAKKKQILGL